MQCSCIKSVLVILVFLYFIYLLDIAIATLVFIYTLDIVYKSTMLQTLYTKFIGLKENNPK